MTIHWEQFTPMASLAGGLLIGIASALFILLNGRIAGISGIIGGLLRPVPGDISWRMAFIGGMLLAPAVYSLFDVLPVPQIDADFSLIVVAGLLFGIGLILSGMSDPSKVIGFLDIAGRWNPSLAFVMGGALIVGLLAFRIARRRTVTLLGGPMRLPTLRSIDLRLVLGRAAFGVGWGLAGFCPGPALVTLAAGQQKALVFVLAMLAGMAIFEIVERIMSRADARNSV